MTDLKKEKKEIERRRYSKPNKQTEAEWKELFLDRICQDLDIEMAINAGLIPAEMMRNFSIVHDIDRLIGEGYSQETAAQVLFEKEIFKLNGNPLSISTLKRIHSLKQYEFAAVFKICNREHNNNKEEEDIDESPPQIIE